MDWFAAQGGAFRGGTLKLFRVAAAVTFVGVTALLSGCAAAESYDHTEVIEADGGNIELGYTVTPLVGVTSSNVTEGEPNADGKPVLLVEVTNLSDKSIAIDEIDAAANEDGYGFVGEDPCQNSGNDPVADWKVNETLTICTFHDGEVDRMSAHVYGLESGGTSFWIPLTDDMLNN